MARVMKSGSRGWYRWSCLLAVRVEEEPRTGLTIQQHITMTYTYIYTYTYSHLQLHTSVKAWGMQSKSVSICNTVSSTFFGHSFLLVRAHVHIHSKDERRVRNEDLSERARERKRIDHQNETSRSEDRLGIWNLPCSSGTKTRLHLHHLRLGRRGKSRIDLPQRLEACIGMQ
jgi:hypothetical protein